MRWRVVNELIGASSFLDDWVRHARGRLAQRAGVVEATVSAGYDEDKPENVSAETSPTPPAPLKRAGPISPARQITRARRSRASRPTHRWIEAKTRPASAAPCFQLLERCGVE